MNLSELHYMILAGVVGLVFKVVWDWLANRGQKKENGHIDAALERLEIQQGKNAVTLADMHERQKKMWEHMLGERSNDGPR